MQYYCTSQNSSFFLRKDLYNTTRLLVGKEEINRENRGEGIDEVINWTRLYKYELRPYCAATVQFVLEKNNLKVPSDVPNPLRARDWFNSDVIYINGYWKGLVKQKPELCDLIGFHNSKGSIVHIGFFLWDLDPGFCRTFEGNTSKPGNTKIQGFFDKRRRINNVIIRKLKL